MTGFHQAYGLSLVCLALVFDGCGQRGPGLVRVTGTVTLDGHPLPHAFLHFTPTAGGRGSHARTDNDGRYALEFLPRRQGAIAGTHRVSISTADESGDSETVPARYNRESNLTATVQPGGTTLDFDLETP